MRLANHSPVLVTGGSGFIGTHLIAALRRNGATVINIDLKPPIESNDRDVWREIDLRDENAVSALISTTRPSVIFNLAAHARLEGGLAAMKVNVDGVSNLINAVKGVGARSHIVQASTQLVAPTAITSFDPTHYEPYGLYGESKAEAERVLRKTTSDDVTWTIVRPSNIWGPFHPTFASQIWRYIAHRLYMHPMGIDPIRSYGYVENVAFQLIRIAEVERDRVDSKTFYLGDEPVRSTIWLDAFSRALTGKPVRRVPMWLLRSVALAGEVSGRIGGPSPINFGRLHRMSADFRVPMQPTFNVLGTGAVSLEEGVAKTVSWLEALEADAG